MSDLPIIMSAPMVRALLDGRKTMTRRLAWRMDCGNRVEWSRSRWQSINPGDRLWVKENFFAFGRWQPNKRAGKTTYSFERRVHDGDLLYAADHQPTTNVLSLISNRGKFGQSEPAWHLRPNIFLERQHSRLTLIVIATKIERLQAISEADAMAEGTEPILVPPDGGSAPHVEGFRDLWGKLHGHRSWDENPEVVALTFIVHRCNIDKVAPA
jgi:hypothetical protein